MMFRIGNKPEAAPADLLDQALPAIPGSEPKRGRVRAFFKTAASRAGGSLFWHLVFGVFMNWSALLWGIGAFAAAIAAMIGWKVAAPEADKDKAKSLVAQAKEAAAKTTPMPIPLIGGKTPEQIAQERAQKLDELRAEADIIGVKYEKDWTLEKLKVHVAKAKQDAKAAAEREEEAKRVAEAHRRDEERKENERRRIAAQELADAQERQSLINRATRVSFGVDATLPLKEMREQVKAAEADAAGDAEYQLRHRLWLEAMERYESELKHGKNAACPACGWQFHTGRTKGEFICQGCGEVCFIKMAKARFIPPTPPKEPQPPKPSVFRRMFGGFKTGNGQPPEDNTQIESLGSGEEQEKHKVIYPVFGDGCS
ncbi:hypothetical protein TA3x_000369 [Tundrisphaera sp. TA3]|uniref:hypothetical protein n=1 Tax=Tundrisphaera sp. TA3 TaxID=3435775 RepID=UPI003EBAA7C1